MVARVGTIASMFRGPVLLVAAAVLTATACGPAATSTADVAPIEIGTARVAATVDDGAEAVPLPTPSRAGLDADEMPVEDGVVDDVPAEDRRDDPVAPSAKPDHGGPDDDDPEVDGPDDAPEIDAPEIAEPGDDEPSDDATEIDEPSDDATEIDEPSDDEPSDAEPSDDDVTDDSSDETSTDA